MPNPQPCYQTLAGDRLGVSFPGRWPIPYVFNPDTQQVYTFSFNTSNPPKVNDVFEIDQLIFPYKFSVAAWILNSRLIHMIIVVIIKIAIDTFLPKVGIPWIPQGLKINFRGRNPLWIGKEPKSHKNPLYC